MSKRALSVEDATQVVNDGRTRIGFIVERRDGQFEAATDAGQSLGRFNTRHAAVSAVIASHRQAVGA